MSALGDFAAKSFVERMLILDGIETARQTERIPELTSLLCDPALDSTARHAVGDTLRALLAESEAEVLQGLASGNRTVQALCVQVAEANPTLAAGPALRALAATETDPTVLLQVLSALGPHRSSEALEVYRAYARHPDPFVSGLCLSMLGVYRDGAALPLLSGVVDAAEGDEEFGMCSVTTEKAIEALGSLETDEALTYLVAKIHHRNPTARRFVHQKIVAMGARAVPMLAPAFDGGTVDEKVLAANLLGTIGGQDAGNVLVSGFDRGTVGHPNVRFAAYEALGQIPSLKGVVCLSDGLGEDDETILLAVVSGLDRQFNPRVAARVQAVLKDGGESGQKVARAIALCRALNLFGAAYADLEAADAVLAAVVAVGDDEVGAVFRDWLDAVGTARAGSDRRRLQVTAAPRAGGRVLAVDDSKSMLLFYKSVAAEIDLDVVSATNGKEALDLLDQGEVFGLIITDLNMPVMDGIEFTRRVRSHLLCESTPVLMATTESEGSQRELAKKAGVNGFLNKPLRPDALQAAIRDHL
ncbi:MAG: response regulator [Deltaproteobacteria bacterium]|nr:response regulator [Deltaproteobacteria bacterium]